MQIDRTREFPLLGIGDADIDIMVDVKEFPERGQKKGGPIIGEFPGGMTANVLSSFSSFGVNCAGILCTGDDERGRESLLDLKKRNIYVDKSIVRKGERTYFTVTLLAPDGEKRMILCFGNAIYPKKEEVDLKLLKSSSICHMTASHVALSIPIAKEAKKNGVIVSLDLEPLTKRMDEETKKELLSNASILFPNEEGLISYSGESNIENGAKRLLSMGPEVVVVTKGEKGAELFTENLHYSIPALNKHPVDTSGAGDTFIGAFLASLYLGYSYKECLILASIASSYQVGAIGCRSGLITLKKALEDMMNIDIM